MINSNNNNFNQIHGLKRVPAKYIRMRTLQCDFLPVKSKLEQLVALNPIAQKFLNITLEIRAETTRYTASNLGTLVASTNLYAFNCSYFNECSQCLSPQLGGSCIWCASNSRCIFVKETIFSRKSIITRQNDFVDTECPNEIEYYQNRDVCTNMKVSRLLETNNANNNYNSKKLSTIEVSYSADTKLADFLRLIIKNRHLNYQTKFKCVFSQNQSVNANDLIQFSNQFSSVKWGSAQLSGNGDGINLNSFDCVYSPYAISWMKKNLDSQLTYFSVWWSSSTSQKEKWTQVKIEASATINAWVVRNLISYYKIVFFVSKFYKKQLVNFSVNRNRCRLVPVLNSVAERHQETLFYNKHFLVWITKAFECLEKK